MLYFNENYDCNNELRLILNFICELINMTRKVLAPGGAKEPIEVLSDFLGREPSIRAFIDAKAEFSL